MKSDTDPEYNKILDSLRLSMSSIIVKAMCEQCIAVHDLAARSGVDIKTVRRVITGEHNWDIGTVAGLLFTLGKRGRLGIYADPAVTITTTTV